MFFKRLICLCIQMEDIPIALDRRCVGRLRNGHECYRCIAIDVTDKLLHGQLCREIRCFLSNSDTMLSDLHDSDTAFIETIIHVQLLDEWYVV